MVGKPTVININYLAFLALLILIGRATAEDSLKEA